jgi:vitamin B12 transporter
MFRNHRIFASGLAAAVLLGASPAGGQSPASDDALAACAGAAAAGSAREARPLTARAEAQYRARMAEQPHDADAPTLLARVLVQCRLPFVGFMAKGRLIGRANELLEAALTIDSTHWAARFTLAMNHFHTPEFLGRTNDAIVEFERLAARPGDHAVNPMYATVYLHLGDLYLRRRRASEAVATWQRGAALFPQHPALRERLRTHALAGDGGGALAQDGVGSRTDAPAPGGARPGAATPDVAPTYTLEGVVVAASGVRMDEARSGTALRRLDVLTTPGGAADLMNALQTGPGTTAAAEGSDLYVRGGDPAESPVFVDGARLFYPGRYETLNGAVFGILDPAVLRSAFFSSGGFSARYGNALSGVLAVETEGRPEVRTGHAALNSVQAGATLQLPLGETLGAWGALRATDATAMLAMHGRSGEFAVAPRALEGMGAVVWEPAAGTQLKATALLDGDRSAREVEAWGHRGPFASRGENRMLGLSGRWLTGGGRGTLRGTLSVAERSSGFRFGVLDRERTDRGTAARADADLEVGARTRLRAGVEAADLTARHLGIIPTGDRLAPGSAAEETDERESASQLGGYLEAELAPARDVALVVGVRADRLPGEDDWTADPRIALAVRADSWTFRVGGGVFHQGRWRTRYTLPDSRSPAGTPRRATHLVAGAERQGEPALRVEGYVKDYGRYVPTGDGPQIGAGRAAGADAIVRWSKRQRLNGWVTYSLLRGRVELEDGRTAPSAVDVTHSLTAVGRLRLAESWELGATARSATGRPYTRHGGEPNADRLPTYGRLDARLTRFWSRPGGTLVGYLEALNVLDRANVAAYSSDGSGETRAIPTVFASRTAVLGLSLSF